MCLNIVYEQHYQNKRIKSYSVMAAKSVKSAEAKWNYGAKIVVQVENKFENGVVVSFVDVDGIEYRGALLSQSNVPHRSV